MPKLYFKNVFILLISIILSCQFLTAAEFYWVQGVNANSSGNWSDLTHWANTSGGAGSAYGAVPTSADNVHFDINSFTTPGQTITIDQTQVSCRNMDWTGVTNTPSLVSSNANTLKIYGSLTLVSAMTLTSTGFTAPISFEATSAGQSIRLGGKTFGNSIAFNGIGGEWTLQDALSTTQDVILNNGILSTNDQAVTARSFNSNNSNIRALNMGASVFNLSYALWFWEVSTSANMSLNAGTSTINGNTGQAGFSQSFRGGSLIYYNLNFNATINNGGTLDGNNTFQNVSFANHGNITGNNNYNNLSFSPGYTYTLSNGKTQTIQGMLSANGTCSAFITLTSSTQSASTITIVSGAVTVSNLYLSNITTTPSGSIANNSLDLGGNIGWTINAPTARNLYWIGNSGNWSDGTHWSLTSGGAADGCPPTLLDNVFFDANSYSLTGQSTTIDIPTARCNSMDWTGMDENSTFASTNALEIYGSLTFVSGMNLSFTGPVNFNATSIGKTVTSAGKSFGNMVSFNGVGGGWTLQDALTSTSDVILNHGALQTNDQTVNARSFNSNNSNIRSLTLGSSTFNLTYALWFWEVSTSTNMIFNAGTSTINGNIGQAGFMQSFRGGNLNYHNLNFNASINMGGTLDGNNTFNNVYFANHGTINGNNTFINLTFSPGYTYILKNAVTQTVNGTLSANGSCTAPIIIQSSTSATSTISHASGAVVLSNVSLTWITATGGSSFTANNSVDGGNNVGWIINTLASQNLYWIGDGGNWSDGNHWSTTSGGSPYGCSPGIGDNVFFDINSFSLDGQTAVVNVPTANCHNMTWNGVTNLPTFSCITSNTMKIYGSLSLENGMILAFAGPVSFEATVTGKSVSTAGKTFGNTITFNGIGGEWMLVDALSSSSDVILNNGTLTTNDQTVNARSFNSNNSNIRSLTLGSSTFNLTYALWFWEVSTSTNMTFNAGTSTINGNIGQAGFSQSFRGGNLSYHNLNFNATINIGGILDGNNTFNNVGFANHGTINGNNTFNNLTFEPGFTYTLKDGKTQTIITDLNISGTGGFPIRIQSETTGTPSTFSKATGSVCVDYVRLSDNTATGGAVFSTGPNSQDLGGNSGWDFNGGAIASVIISPSQLGTVCSGTDVYFTAIPSNGGSPSYDWLLNGTLQQSGTSDLFTTVAQNDGDVIECIMTSTGACNSADTISTSLALTVGTSSFAGTISAIQDTICIGNNGQLIATGNSGNIQWQSSSNTLDFFNINNATDTTYTSILTQTTYFRFYTNNGACADTSAVIEVAVLPVPVASFTYSQTIGYIVNFVSTSSNATSYFWDFGNNNTSTAQNPDHTFPFDGTYPVKLIVNNGCQQDTFTLDVIVLKLVGIELVSENQLSIQPNPFNEILNIFISAPEALTLNIFNVLGQIVYTQFIPAQQGNSIQIDFSQKPSGIYTLQLSNKNGTLNKKVLKTD